MATTFVPAATGSARTPLGPKVVHTQEMKSRGSIQEVPGEKVFKELLSYFGESHVQGRHHEPGVRAGDGRDLTSYF